MNNPPVTGKGKLDMLPPIRDDSDPVYCGLALREFLNYAKDGGHVSLADLVRIRQYAKVIYTEDVVDLVGVLVHRIVEARMG